MNPEQLQRILEAAIMVAGRPLTVADMQKLFDEVNTPSVAAIRDTLTLLQEAYADRGIELLEVASGFQFQARSELSPWLSLLWEERAPRYSRALLETLALIAYRQPITRAEIEDIRGVTVSTNIIKTLQEREWIRVVGHRDVPGKPALFATTKTFLDHLSLKNLGELPPLSDLNDLESQEEKLHIQLDLVNNTQDESTHSEDDVDLNTTVYEKMDTDALAEHMLNAGVAEQARLPKADTEASSEQALEKLTIETTTDHTAVLANPYLDPLEHPPEEVHEISTETSSSETTNSDETEENPTELSGTEQ